MITCREATALHTAADDGVLTGAKRFFYNLHMTVCPHCKRYRRQLDATVEVLQRLRPAEAPPPALVELLAAELEKKL